MEEKEYAEYKMICAMYWKSEENKVLYKYIKIGR